MEKLRILFLVIFCTQFCNSVFSQCENTNAGLFCDPGIPNGAPLLCDLDCLDGFTARMPQMDSILLESQPENLCRNGNGNQGDANNLSWFAFVAGSTDILFRITPSNCTVEGNNLTGIQAGIYSKCYTWEEVICFGDCFSNAFEIGGDLFTPGETYFFFIDGCNGSICDYTVDVLRGSQPYPLPDIDTLIIDYPSDTLCTNIETTITTVGLVQDSISYSYTVFPVTPEYPTGRHPDTLSSVTTWSFSEAGTYTICVEATNGCDITPMHCQDIVVRDLEPEVFSDMTLCMEDLPSFRGPDMEDPNNDGVVGWQADQFFAPGLNRDTVFLNNGCNYTQEITVNVLPLNNRQDVTTYACPNDFPFDFMGFNVTGPVSNLSVTLDNLSANGCDSLINLTVEEVVFDAGILLSDCTNGQGVLSLEIVDFPLANLASISIVWRDPMGDVLVENGNPLERIATISGIYEVDVVVTIDTFICTYVIQSNTIDLNNLLPGSPQVFQKDSILCRNGSVGIYKVIGTGEIDEVFNWTYPVGVSVLAESGDSLVLNWADVMGGQICVAISNSCGTSLPRCFDVINSEVIMPGIIVDSVFCLGDTLDFMFSGDSGLTYNWVVSGGVRVSTIDSNTVGPHKILVEDVMDSLRITFSAENGSCISNESVKDIKIINPLDTPLVFCTATDNSVLFQWGDVVGATDYQITVLTGNTGIINGNSYLVEGLLPGDPVTIAIRSLSDVDCADSEEVEFSCIAGCDPIEFSISVADTFLCVGNETVAITLNLPNISDPQIEILGMGVEGAVFNSANLVPGSYDIVGIITIDGCQYVDNSTIEIGSTPAYTLNIDGPICPQDETGILTFDLTEGIVFFDGQELVSNTISVSPGNYNFEVRGDNGCSNFDNIFVNPIQIPDLNLAALFDIDQGTILNLPIDIGNFDTNRINSVTWYDENGQDLCSGDFTSCGVLRFEPDDDQLICADVNFDDNCTITLCTQVNLRRIVNIFTPDIFTPNQDGINDEFIFLSNQPDIIIEGFFIFNRWGELMHSIQNIPLESDGASWDGNYRGKAAAEGVYVYVIEYNQDGKTLIKKGDVTLIR